MISKRIRNIWQIDNHTFGILWNDGKEMHYVLKSVQECCPCALCHTSRNAGTKPLTNPSVKAKNLENIGSYALKINFEEGCSSGIYDFDFLYTLGVSQ